jgi:hypothetical protein
MPTIHPSRAIHHRTASGADYDRDPKRPKLVDGQAASSSASASHAVRVVSRSKFFHTGRLRVCGQQTGRVLMWVASELSSRGSVFCCREQVAFGKSSKVFVSRLHSRTTEDALAKHFAECGHVRRVNLRRDPRTNKNLRYAEVEFDSITSATFSSSFVFVFVFVFKYGYRVL